MIIDLAPSWPRNSHSLQERNSPPRVGLQHARAEVILNPSWGLEPSLQRPWNLQHRGSWTYVASPWPLATGYWLLATGQRMSAPLRWAPTGRERFPTREGAYRPQSVMTQKLYSTSPPLSAGDLVFRPADRLKIRIGRLFTLNWTGFDLTLDA